MSNECCKDSKNETDMVDFIGQCNDQQKSSPPLSDRGRSNRSDAAISGGRETVQNQLRHDRRAMKSFPSISVCRPSSSSDNDRRVKSLGPTCTQALTSNQQSSNVSDKHNENHDLNHTDLYSNRQKDLGRASPSTSPRTPPIQIGVLLRTQVADMSNECCNDNKNEPDMVDFTDQRIDSRKSSSPLPARGRSNRSDALISGGGETARDQLRCDRRAMKSFPSISACSSSSHNERRVKSLGPTGTQALVSNRQSSDASNTYKEKHDPNHKDLHSNRQKDLLYGPDDKDNDDNVEVPQHSPTRRASPPTSHTRIGVLLRNSSDTNTSVNTQTRSPNPKLESTEDKRKGCYIHDDSDGKEPANNEEYLKYVSCGYYSDSDGSEYEDIVEELCVQSRRLPSHHRQPINRFSSIKRESGLTPPINISSYPQRPDERNSSTFQESSDQISESDEYVQVPT